MDERRAKADLAQHLGSLRACVRRAIERYVAECRGLRHQLSARSESSIINDMIVTEVRKTFASTPGVNVIKKGGSVMLSIAGKYLCRFKKLDPRRGASYIGTRAALRFAAQMSIVGTANQAVNLFVGYVRDQAELLNSSAWVMRPDGRRIAWSFEITAIAPVVPIVKPMTSVETPRRRVTGKKNNDSKQTDVNGI